MYLYVKKYFLGYLADLWHWFWEGYKVEKIHNDLDALLETLNSAPNKPSSAEAYKLALMEAPSVKDVTAFEDKGERPWLEILCYGTKVKFLKSVSKDHKMKHSFRANGRKQKVIMGDDFRQKEVMAKWSESDEAYWIYFTGGEQLQLRASDKALSDIAVKEATKCKTRKAWFDRRWKGYNSSFKKLPWVAYAVILLGIVAYLKLPALVAKYRPAAKEKVTQMNVKLPMQDPYYAMSVQSQGLISFRAHEHLFQDEKSKKVDITKLLGEVESMKYAAPDTPTVSRWQRTLFVIQDISGREAAIKSAKELKKLLTKKRIFYHSASDKTVQPVVDAYFADAKLTGPEAVKALNRQQKQILKKHLKWFGLLALAPKGTENKELRSEVLTQALKGTIQVSFMPTLYVFGLIFGSLLLYLFVTVRRDLYRIGLGNENLYAGTFGCWIWLFLGFQILMPFVMIKIAPSYTLLGSGIAFLLSLICVYWPVYKGQSWRKTFYAIGWHKGDGWSKEAFIGALGYIMTIPLIVIALIFTLFMFSPIVGGSFSGVLFVLKKLGTPEGGAILAAAHPIVSVALQADFQTACMILFLACFCAPVVEETVFRGVLYHHLRETTAPMWERTSIMKAAFYSIAISTIIEAFVFAAIHPQGLQGIPVLMAGAIGMTMLRQYRGSLIAPMVMHAIMNFVTLGTVMFLYR